MFKLFRMEDPVKGVFSLEFIAHCHINADIRIIPTESGPELSSTFAEGDGRSLRFSHQEMGPAKRPAYQRKGKSNSVGRFTVIPEWTFHDRTAIPQGGDKEVLAVFVVSCQ
jgi:hypothetical protein